MAAWLARASQAARAGEYALEEPGSFSYWIGRASQKRKADKTPEVSPTKSDASTSSKVGDDEASLLELGDDEASLLDNDVDDEPPKSRARAPPSCAAAPSSTLPLQRAPRSR